MVVGLIFGRKPKTEVPMMTAARAWTTMPMPIAVEADSACWERMEPERAAKPFPMASPRIFMAPSLLEREVTKVGLSPVARRRSPSWVERNQSRRNFPRIARMPERMRTR